MKAYLIIYYAAGLISLLATSCRVPNQPYSRGPKIIEQSYIANFIHIDTLTVNELYNFKFDNNTLRRTTGGITPETTYNISDGLVLSVSANWSIAKSYRGGFTYDPYAYDEKFATLAKDTEYNDVRLWGGLNGDDYTIAIIDTLSAVKITSDTDFDSEHTAGANINSMFSVYFENPYELIRNNYKIPEGGYQLDGIHYDVPCLITGGELSTMTFADKPFIGNTYLLKLNKAPEKTGSYSFTVEITKTNGEILRVKSKPIKIAGIK